MSNILGSYSDRCVVRLGPSKSFAEMHALELKANRRRLHDLVASLRAANAESVASWMRLPADVSDSVVINWGRAVGLVTNADDKVIYAQQR